MIYITGDKHGEYSAIRDFCYKHKASKDDFMIILGDHGANYYDPPRDQRFKKQLQDLPMTFVLLHGNHDQRVLPGPGVQVMTIATDEVRGVFLYEPQYPNLLYPIFEGPYEFNGVVTYFFHGAYSADKMRRQKMRAMGIKHYRWFPDEQMTDMERNVVMSHLKQESWPDDKPVCFLSHTCPITHLPSVPPLPYEFEPDNSTEEWLAEIERTFPYDYWFCGHWHTEQWVDEVRFLYNDIIEFPRAEDGDD